MTQIDAEREARIRAFMDAMILKLKLPRNVAKGDWLSMDPFELLALLKIEVLELEREADRCVIDIERPPIHVLEECYDVAAFAFMLWDRISWRARRSRWLT